MVFWNLHVEPGLSYENTLPNAFHISAAVLDTESAKKENITSVVIETNGTEAVVCNLSAKHGILQVPLDINFEVGEEIKIFLKGSSHVYLVGHTVAIKKQEVTEEVAYNGIETSGGVKQKKKKLDWSVKSSNESPAPDDVFSQKTTSAKSADDAQKAKFAKKLSKKAKKKMQKASVASEDSETKEGKPGSAKKVSSVSTIGDILETDDSDEDNSYVPSGEESEEIEEEEEEEESEDEEEIDEQEQNEEAVEEEEEKDENDAEDDVVAVEEESEEEEDIIMESPPKKKRALSPPSSAGRTPMVKSNKKARKQQEEASPDLIKKKKPMNKNKKTKEAIQDSNTTDVGDQSGSNLGTPQNESKKKSIKAGGLVVEDLTVGNGVEAKLGKKVSVYYEGKLKNGKVFDKVKSGPQFQFKVGANEVIKAWDVGVLGMKVGGKRKIVAPPSMAYGKQGAPPKIPPNAFLTFEIELKAIN